MSDQKRKAAASEDPHAAMVGVKSDLRPGVTIYDLGPSLNPDSAISAKLIDMGWTPPSGWPKRTQAALAQQSEREPLTADVECITDESGTDYSVSVRGPGLRNPLYSDVWTKKKQAELLARWLNTEVLPAAASKREPLSQAAQDVLAERQRQISVEGWTPEHDDEHGDGDLAAASAAYAIEANALLEGMTPSETREPPFCWPWGREWWKSRDARRNLIKAGALILAELERLDRAHGIGKEGV